MRQDWVELTHEEIDTCAATEFLRHPGAGALALFLGTTRRFTGDRETIRLEYECYESMALAEMRRLVQAAKARWPLPRVCVIHRLGRVPAAQTSVLVGVASAHRATAIQACQYLIDTLKKDIPIWKREFYADGSTEWISGGSPSLGPEA